MYFALRCSLFPARDVAACSQQQEWEFNSRQLKSSLCCLLADGITMAEVPLSGSIGTGNSTLMSLSFSLLFLAIVRVDLPCT